METKQLQVSVSAGVWKGGGSCSAGLSSESEGTASLPLLRTEPSPASPPPPLHLFSLGHHYFSQTLVTLLSVSWSISTDPSTPKGPLSLP